MDAAEDVGTSLDAGLPGTVRPHAAVSRRAPLLALLSASGISAVGSAMTMVAIPWFVLSTTGSGARTGLVAGAETLVLLLSLALTGSLLDHYGGRAVSSPTSSRSSSSSRSRSSMPRSG